MYHWPSMFARSHIPQDLNLEPAKESRTDRYITMTLFQLEKQYGTSSEAQKFIADLIKGTLASVYKYCPESRPIFFQGFQPYSCSTFPCPSALVSSCFWFLGSLCFACPAEARRVLHTHNPTTPKLRCTRSLRR